MSDTTDDMEGAAMFEAQTHPSELWEDGFHETREGLRIKLTKMTDFHLENTIKFFKSRGYDTTPLERELKLRHL
ncbi:MAG: hypothetical protein U1E54_03770 [Candidatus Levybacteria bacterium]|nr:hypothetical protein [Candidatus Levybacteria bacterium]